ncbi:MAG: hypothetical protein QW575_06260 [Thermoproteota archaeon]
MKHIFRDENEKKIVLDPEEDVELSGNRSGYQKSLYLHYTEKTKQKVFYFVEERSISIVPEEVAKKYFELRTQEIGEDYPDEDNISNALRIWPDIFKEEI